MVAQVEVPDGYRVVTLVGVETDGTPRVVQLDGTGRIVAVIQGEIEGITGNVTVDQSDSVREVQGSDGATLRTVALDANGQLIMVPRGQSGNYMSVDASGFLTAVMKGEYSGSPTTLAVDSSGNIVAVVQGNYGGTLKTLTTDANGRLQIVPYDPDDIWGNAVAMGNAELAAVMSPAHRYDRRGNILLVDSFEDGLVRWYSGLAGTGSSIALSSYRARTGAYSAKVTGGSDGPALAYLSLSMPYPKLSRCGLEFSFELYGQPTAIELELFQFNGTTVYRPMVKWTYSTGNVDYLDSDNSWQSIDTGVNLSVSARAFHTLKMVYDMSAHEYVRLLLEDTEYPLTDIGVHSAANAANPAISVLIYVYSSAGSNKYAYIDDVIVTQNEPAN
jgi:hypothetical protein